MTDSKPQLGNEFYLVFDAAGGAADFSSPTWVLASGVYDISGSTKRDSVEVMKGTDKRYRNGLREVTKTVKVQHPKDQADAFLDECVAAHAAGTDVLIAVLDGPLADSGSTTFYEDDQQRRYIIEEISAPRKRGDAVEVDITLKPSSSDDLPVAVTIA